MNCPALYNIGSHLPFTISKAANGKRMRSSRNVVERRGVSEVRVEAGAGSGIRELNREERRMETLSLTYIGVNTGRDASPQNS